MKKQFGYGLFIVGFLLLCLIPSVGMLLPDGGEAAGSNARPAGWRGETQYGLSPQALRLRGR